MKLNLKNQTLISHYEDTHLRQALGIIYIYSFAVHLGFLLVFRYFDARQMEVINYFSPIFYVVAYICNTKGRIALGASVAIIEAVFHGLISLVYIGANANFHLYVVLVYLLIFFLYRLKMEIRILLSVFITALYVWLFVYSINHQPGANFPNIFISVSGTFNLVNMACVLSIFAISYSFFIRKNIKLLEEAEIQQRLLNTQKDKFFSIFSHDLKNPISSLNNFIELLLTRYDKMEEERRKMYLQQIYNAVGDTYKLVNSLLEWSQLQMNNIEIVPETIKIDSVVNEIKSLLEHHAASKEIDIEIAVPGSHKVYADAQMFHSILRNLISNAIKFTHSGGKVIINSRIRNGHTKINVTDSGIGIAEENIKEIFSMERVEVNVGTANERGTGLGLVVAKEFAEKNRGTLNVISKLDNGSTFTITLPTARNTT